ncbi:MAG: LysR family transcriptional regulator [Neomegalonema sp.]|nr:LysR family transcriptional regulator [Neomegalonema sp.]
MWTIADLDLPAVSAFAKVAEERSFRAAAKALGVSKSTVSQRVVRLEERLGVRLFDRTTRNVRLTDAGESYYEAVSPALAALRAADELIGDMKEKPTGRLRLTAPMDLGHCVMGDVVGRFSERHPDVEVRVDLTDRVVNLVEEGFDLAVRSGPLEDSFLTARRLSSPQSKRLFASPDYLAEIGTPARPEDLSGHKILAMTGHREGATWRFEAADGPLSIAVRPYLAINSFPALLELAVAGRGVARLPELRAVGAVASGRLVEVLADFAPPPSALYAVTASARRQSASVRAMIEVLAERLMR